MDTVLGLSRATLTIDTTRVQGVRGSLLLLMPEFISRLSDEFFWPAAMYGPKYLQAPLLSYQLATTREEKMIAAAAVAVHARTWDLGLTRRYAREAWSIADSLPESEREGCAISMILHFLEGELNSELSTTSFHIDRALDQYAVEHGSYPSEAILSDPQKLWDVVRPLLPQVMVTVFPGADRPRSRDPRWADLSVNRLTSTPGLRISTIRWLPDQHSGHLKPIVEFTYVLQ